MKRAQLSTLVGVMGLGLLAACSHGAPEGSGAALNPQWAAGARAPAVISNPFHEFSGYPGLKLGKGDVPGQCQSYDNASNQNPYAPFVRTVNVISGDPINTGAGVNQGCRAPQNETSIAVNPANPDNLVAGANDYRSNRVDDGTGVLRNDSSGWVYTSLDGGRSWRNIKLPGLSTIGDPAGVAKKVTSVGDPAIAFGRNNTVYYANIAFNRVDASDAIFVSVSRDGGLSWEAPTLIANSGGATFFNDKVYIGADPRSGAAYVSWTRFRTNPKAGYVSSPIYVSRTANDGQSWQGQVEASGPYLYSQGSVPVVGPDGSVYLSFESAVAADNFNDYNIVAKSTDGGQHWTQTVVSRNVDETYPVVLGRLALSGLNFRLNTFPALAVDPATGQLYLAWADNRRGTTAQTSSQVFLQTSADGQTWTAPRQLTSTPQDKVFPWVAAQDGRVIVSYYTREFAGTASKQIDFGYVASSDSGQSWTSSTRLTEQSSDPAIQFAQGGFIGDYTGVALGSDHIAHPLWTDFRGNPGVTSPNQDAVTARIALP